ncbi:hypothetical protein CEXT_793311 [Caerostris extrusa]|uniref:Uncharacterized protein n=1 Tax=Caerostris extrusa TaxID=172846 RepID=A0AAV4SZB3_CAEEX|nr:hypothetical protein CEXT_793311 [Caerostris extrusa]
MNIKSPNTTGMDTSLFCFPIECPAVWRWWIHGMNKRARDEMMYGPVGVDVLLIDDSSSSSCSYLLPLKRGVYKGKSNDS